MRGSKNEGRLRRHNIDAPVRRSHDEKEAQRILRVGCEFFGLDVEELRALKKGESRKAVLAALIRLRTAVPNAWIAEHLHLGLASRVSHCVRRADAERELVRQLAGRLER